MTETIVGIDLGTTHSLVGVVDGGLPIVLAGDDNERLVPSAVFWDDDGRVLVGREALQARGRNPGRVITSVKRLIGRRAGESPWQPPYIVERMANGRIGIPVKGNILSPEEISAEILKTLKVRAEWALGKSVSKAVITVPAYFGEAQRAATKHAGELAGLEVVRILNEPTAAALAYGQDRGKGSRKIAVYDFGGGTFDLSILELNEGIFQVLATHGDTQLGGDDVDGSLAQWMWQNGGVGEWEKQAMSLRERVVMAAREAKEKLSISENQRVEIPFIKGNTHLSVDITREKFEQIVAPWIAKTMQHVERAMIDAGIGRDDLNAVVLVGGSTRIPAVQKALADWFGREVDTGQNPDEAIAKGAIIQAGILEGTLRNALLIDVTPLSLGIETVGGLMNVIISRNSTIPAKAGELFTNAVAGQTRMRVKVLQGERELAADNWELGSMDVEFDALPRGQARVGVQFSIDADGMLSVLARDTRTGVDKLLEIRDLAVDVEDSRVEAMISGSLEHAFDDMRGRMWAEEKLKAEEMLPALDMSLEMMSGELAEEELMAISDARGAVEQALMGGDAQDLKQALKTLDSATEGLAARIVEQAIEDSLQKRGLV